MVPHKELPKLLRFFIKVSVGANPLNTTLYFLCHSTLSVCLTFCLFASITESIIVGITIALLSLISNLGSYCMMNFAKQSTDAATQKIKMEFLNENVNKFMKA